jgi:hypothetical protein
MTSLAPMRAATAALAIVATVGSSARPTPKLDEIVARAITAQGGVAALRSVRAERMTGTIVFGTEPRRALTVELKRPNRIRTEIVLPAGRFIQAYDGVSGWTARPAIDGGRPVAMTAVEERELAESADLDGPLLDWKASRLRIEFEGRRLVEGRPAFDLRITNPDGSVRRIFLDTASYRKVRWEKVLDRDGQETTFESLFDDYRAVGPLVLPFRIRSGSLGGGRPQEIVFKAIVLNPDIPDARFAMPRRSPASAPSKRPARRPSRGAF